MGLQRTRHQSLLDPQTEAIVQGLLNTGWWDSRARRCIFVMNQVGEMYDALIMEEALDR